MRLRPYQKDAVDGIISHLRGRRSTLCVMPTGSGKTIVFASLARMARKRVMVIAHRDILIRQAAEKIEAVTGTAPDIEKAEERSREGKFLSRPKIVVASVQTLSNANRLRRFHPRDFGLIIVDEGHRAVAGSYMKVLDWFCTSKVLGVTATPDRLDKKGLATVFESVAYRLGISDAIADGWLVPVRCVSPKIANLELAGLKTVNGDFVETQLQRRIAESEGVLHEYAVGIAEASRGRKTIVFADSVKSAEILADILRRPAFGIRSGWICGDQQLCPEQRRTAIIDGFRNGSISHLVNVGIATEGFDVPDIECVAVCRPTQSRALYAQMLGRGTRPHDPTLCDHETAEQRTQAIAASRKPCCTVIDFTYGHGHTLAGPADVLGEAMDPEDIARAKAMLATGGVSCGVAEALEEAHREVQEKRDKARRKAEKRDALRQAAMDKRASVTMTGDVRLREVDVMGRYGITPESTERRLSKSARGITAKQLSHLLKQVPDADQMDPALQDSLYREMVRRRMLGLATLKQAKILKREGMDANMKFPDAIKALDRIFGKVTA